MGLFSRQTLRGSLFFSGRRTVVSYSKLLINSSFFQCNTGTVCCVCVCAHTWMYIVCACVLILCILIGLQRQAGRLGQRSQHHSHWCGMRHRCFAGTVSVCLSLHIMHQSVCFVDTSCQSVCFYLDLVPVCLCSCTMLHHSLEVLCQRVFAGTVSACLFRYCVSLSLQVLCQCVCSSHCMSLWWTVTTSLFTVVHTG